jgi:hypothetical protein
LAPVSIWKGGADNGRGEERAMIERAGYPGVAADLDVEKPTPNLGASD